MNIYHKDDHYLTSREKTACLEIVSKRAPESDEITFIEMGDFPKTEEILLEKLEKIFKKDHGALIVSYHPLVFHLAVEWFGRAGCFVYTPTNLYEPTKKGFIRQYDVTLEVRYGE